MLNAFYIVISLIYKQLKYHIKKNSKNVILTDTALQFKLLFITLKV